ncbi:flavin monoamine oxidase family protein [Cyanobium sp. ATX-6F1]|uniref:flavin monoamine oxidase family protein n=1 Tax=Cyanobium sp. ATX-6F1 TaxID=3137388 RepID=UPI0039BE9C0B
MVLALSANQDIGKTRAGAFDVAIIGGGVAGNYTAWRLIKDQPELNIVVIEQSARLGGRLYSEHVSGIESVQVEHGGMRFSRNHKLLGHLVDYLGLPTRPFKSVLANNNPIFIRGHHTSLDKIKAGDKVPYRIPAELGTNNPGEIVPASILLFLSKQGMRPSQSRGIIDCLEEASFNGKSFKELSFKELLENVCSPEVLAYYNDVHGYWVDTHADVSARELLLGFLPFVSDSDTITISTGMQSLPSKLAELASQHGCKYRTSSRLRSIRRSSEQFELAVTSDHSNETIVAKRVVLALPPNRIRKIEGLAELAPRLKDRLNSVVEILAVKTHFVYNSCWWRSSQITEGEARTDLPMRQCLYMGSDQSINNPTNELTSSTDSAEPSVLLASYTDSDASDYWRNTADKSSTCAGVHGPTDPSLQCSESVIRELTSQLETLHSQSIKLPYWASMCDWKEQPSGVATHSWRSCYDSAKIIPLIRQPNPSLPLYICGEAFSQEQGWVNGALRSAEAMLRSCFNLQAPSWANSSIPIDIA